MKSVLFCAAFWVATMAQAQPALPALQAKPVALAANATDAVAVAAVAAHYATLVHASYSDSLGGARAMHTAILGLIQSPSANSLDKAKSAWLSAREFYNLTQAFRFYAGPIDDKNGPEGRMNAWPLDEAYIDYVAGKPLSGIINNPKVNITKRGLIALNERGGEENIATGWHAIEFLLWGQDLSETGPGNRQFDDFVDGRVPNAKRRKAYLQVVSELLVDDLAGVTQAWAPSAKNYRANFEKAGSEALRRMLVGIGSLTRGELAGEHIEVPLASQNQEDETSCFSDNTHRDIVGEATGIENVWLGRLKRADGSILKGASLRDLTAAKDEALAQRTSLHIATSVKAAEEIQAPFDREIVDPAGRLRVQAVADALKIQSRDFVDVAKAIGITKLTLAETKKK